MAQVTEDGKPEFMYDGFTYERLESAFRRACDPNDWKAPIEVWCLGEDVCVMVSAIRFFTATDAKVALNTRTMRYRIKSIGYRAGPAGDH